MRNKILFLISKGVVFLKKNFKNNLPSNISIITILLLLNTMGIVLYSTNDFLNKLTNVESVRVYLKKEDKVTVETVKKILSKIEGVASVKYYSSKDAYQYLQSNEEINDYTKILPPELFPAFIEIKIKNDYRDLNYIKSLKERIEQIKGVEKTSIGESWILNFIKIKYSINFFFVIILIFICSSIASITFNMIKLNMFKFKNEIKIMSLVGATKSFIITPIIFASIIENLISFFIALGISYGIFKFLVNQSVNIIGIRFFMLPPLSYWILYLIIFIALTTIFSYISSSSFLKNTGPIHESN